MDLFLGEPFPINSDKRAVTEWKYGDKRSFYKLHNTNSLKDILNSLKSRSSDNYPISDQLFQGL